MRIIGYSYKEIVNLGQHFGQSIKQLINRYLPNPDKLPSNTKQASSPFPVVHGTIIFLLLIALCITIVGLICSNYLDISIKLLILKAFIFIIGIGIIAYTFATSTSDFLRVYLLLLILLTPTIIFIAFHHGFIQFALSIVMAILVSLIICSRNSDDKKFNKFVRYLYVLSFSVNLIYYGCQIGFIPASSINAVEINAAINEQFIMLINLAFYFRQAIGFLFFVSLLILSVWDTIVSFNPPTPPIPLFYLKSIYTKDKTTHFDIFTRPFIIIALAIIRCTHMLIITLYKMVTTVGYFLYSVAAMFIKRIWGFLTDKQLWRSLLTVFITFFIVIALSWWVSKITIDIYDYLTISFVDVQFNSITYIVIFFISSILSLSLIRPLWFHWYEWSISLERNVMAGAILSLSFLVTSIIVRIYKLFIESDIAGFDGIGIISLIILAPFIIVVVLKFKEAISREKDDGDLPN